MSDPSSPPAAPAPTPSTPVPASTMVKARRRSPVRWPVVLLIIVLAGVVCFFGYYQDEVGYFMNLKLWDRGAPARTVQTFLQACRDKNETVADQQLDPLIKPRQKNGQWVGYYVHNPHFNRDFDYPFSSFVPSDSNSPASTEFVMRGDGAAIVTIGEHQFHLQMEKGSWKIAQII